MKRRLIISIFLLTVLSVVSFSPIFADEALGSSDWQMPSGAPQTPDSSNLQTAPPSQTQLGSSDWQMPAAAPQVQGSSDWLSKTYHGQVQTNAYQAQTNSNQPGQSNLMQPGQPMNYPQPQNPNYPQAQYPNYPQPQYPNYQQPPVQQSTSVQPPSRGMNIGAITNAISAVAMPLAAVVSARMNRGYGMPFGGFGVPAYPSYYSPFAAPVYPSYGYGGAGGLANFVMGRALNQRLFP